VAIILKKRKAKISAAQKGRIRPEETKAKMSASLRGKKAWNKGKTNSEETKAKISATLKGKSQPQVQCPSCQKIGGRPKCIATILIIVRSVSNGSVDERVEDA
jgi:hypothetical protein